MSFCITLHYTEKSHIYKSARERHTDSDTEYMHKHKRDTCKHTMHNIQNRCNEQECKFKRLCYTCQKCRQCRRKQKSSDNFFLFVSGTSVHCKCRTRQTEHHKREFTCHKTRCVNGKFRCVRVGKLCKEYILCTVYCLTCNLH